MNDNNIKELKIDSTLWATPAKITKKNQKN